MLDDQPKETIRQRLEKRLGKSHARVRMGLEHDHYQAVLGHPGKFFHLENWYSIHAFIRTCLRMACLYRRGQRNATAIQLRHNEVRLAHLPEAFAGFRILHLSDLHVDMHPDATHALIERLRDIDYDICVMTGDYRARTYGDIDAAMRALAGVRLHLKERVYAVLGNHDSIFMVPAMEDMGIRLLLNESLAIERGGEKIYLAGVDDAHYFRVDNIEKSAAALPDRGVKILLSHTPEIFRQAAHAGYDLFLCGHTHGGQICLPGGIPITLDARCPRHVGRGRWQHQQMQGYTSVGAGTSIVNVRLNCPPEITVHTLLPA